jgi:hypothetical protein
MSFFDILTNAYFIAFASFALAFLALVPYMYKSFMRWKETAKPRDFASAVFLGWVNLYLLTPSFLLLLHDVGALKLTISAEYYRTLNLLLMTLACFSLSKMAVFLKQLQKNKNTTSFVLMIFFGVISTYCLTINLMSLAKMVILKHD